MRNALVALALALASGWTLTASAEAPATDPHALIAQMTATNASLSSYKVRVHVNVRTNIPFMSPKLNGTSYFKRPDSFRVVFDSVPGYAKGFSKLFNDIGDPAAWEKDQNITFDGTQTVNGQSLLVLRLTKKIHSDILDHTLAFVDPATLELRRMEWHYTNGDSAVMTQTYSHEGDFTLITSQHAVINIHHIYAVADSTYATYDTNVPVDDTVFTAQ